jgi:hypothetical protein
MEKTRRGFISASAALGVGVFAYAAAPNVLAGKSKIAANDVLLALPGDLYYAIPNAELSEYSVSLETFSAAQTQREEEEVTMRGGKKRPPRSAAMGVRG